MKNARTMRLEAPKQNSTPLAERGRMLFVPDVIVLLKHQKSARWVMNRFAPEHKHKLGRDPYWWESDAIRWLDEQQGAA